MRHPSALRFLAALAAVACLPAAAAQEDGCEQANPCKWSVIVDSQGFLESDWTFTAGDWIVLLLSNDDEEAAHTVSVGGTSIQLTAPALGEAQSVPFQLSAGPHDLSDQPTGDTAAARAVEGDAVAYEAGATGGTTSGKGRIPGFEAGLALLAVGGLAVLARKP